MSKATFANIRQKIFSIHWLKGKKDPEGRDTVPADKDFVVYHLPKSQIEFLTEFNDRRTQTVGDLSMYV